MDTPRMKSSSSVGHTNYLKSSLSFNLLPLSTHSHSFPGESSVFPPPDDFELGSSPSLAYTSLRDITASSSTTKGHSLSCSGIEISTSNRLVKQAAWSYLQPMPASMQGSSSNKHFFVSVWEKLSQELKHPVNACLGFINRHVIKNITLVIDKLFREIRVRRTE